MTNVVGLFETRHQARRAIEALRGAGLKPEEMSILMRDRSLAEEVAQDVGADNSDAVGVGAVGGGVFGGMAGLLVGLGVIAIPGLGPFLAAGPIAAALAGGAVGATAGGMAGAIIHHGVTEEEAGFYSSAVERGGILLSVKTAKKREAEVRRILESNGMKDAEYHRSRWEKDPDFQYDVDGGEEMSTRSDKHADDRDKAQVDGKAGGTAVGGTAGAVIGAAVGGPIGAAIGAVAGAALGGGAGALADYNEAEPHLKEHWEANHKDAAPWKEAKPSYKYGWESHDRPEYQGKSWDDVSTHLKTGWTGKGNWEDHEPMVRGAWEARAARPVEVVVVEEERKTGKGSRGK